MCLMPCACYTSAAHCMRPCPSSHRTHRCSRALLPGCSALIPRRWCGQRRRPQATPLVCQGRAAAGQLGGHRHPAGGNVCAGKRGAWRPRSEQMPVLWGVVVSVLAAWARRTVLLVLGCLKPSWHAQATQAFVYICCILQFDVCALHHCSLDMGYSTLLSSPSCHHAFM